MAELITLLSQIPSNTIPIVLAIVGPYFMFRKIDSDRHVTKLNRDKDNQELYDSVVKLKFQVTELQGRSQHHDTLLEDLRAQMALLNNNIVKMSVMIDNFYELMKNKSNS